MRGSVDHQFAVLKIEDPVFRYASARVKIALSDRILTNGRVSHLNQQNRFIAPRVTSCEVRLILSQYRNVRLGFIEFPVIRGDIDRQPHLNQINAENLREPCVQAANSSGMRGFLSPLVDQISVDQLQPLSFEETGRLHAVHIAAGKSLSLRRTFRR